jgi:hypothetical protein
MNPTDKKSSFTEPFKSLKKYQLLEYLKISMSS